MPVRRLGVLAAIVALLVLVGLPPGGVQPADAACGTSWQSKVEPPESVLVYRAGSGAVEKVGLKRYVAVVMASGEWPTSLPVALLEAGAQATKQYAWYYTLEGNHRDGYVNASGKCYDVRDDSQDQVYRPESSEPTDKQKDARDALWGLSLRKNDKFLLTGYRQGSATKCGADADEWKLYATSGRDCANQGLDSIEILHTYYSPKLTKTWAPGTDPAEQEPAEDEDEALESSSPDGEGEPTSNADGAAPTDEPEADEPEAEGQESEEQGSEADDPPDDDTSEEDGPSGPLTSIRDWLGSLFDRDE